jgi:hypothetical protein
MQGSESDTVFQSGNDIFVNQCTCKKLAAAVYGPVSYRVDFREAADYPVIIRGQFFDNSNYCFRMCGQMDGIVENRLAVTYGCVLQMTIDSYSVAKPFR